MLVQGQSYISNFIDPATGEWRVDATSYMTRWNLSAGSAAYRGAFSGAACARVSSRTTCARTDAAWYLLEASRAISSASARLADPANLTADLGLVESSVCYGRCNLKRIPLNPNTTYLIVTATSSNSDETCDIRYSLGTFATGSAGEADLSADTELDRRSCLRGASCLSQTCALGNLSLYTW